MNILTNRNFWAAILIITGFTFLVEELFDLNIPVFSILISLLLIYLGLQIILSRNKTKPAEGFSHHGEEGEETVIFADEETQFNGTSGKKEYTTIFSSRFINLQNIDLSKGNIHLKLITIFSECRVYIPRGVNFKIKSSSAFASTKLPGGRNYSFGEGMDSPPNFNPEKPTLFIEAETVFSSLKIVEI